MNTPAEELVPATKLGRVTRQWWHETTAAHHIPTPESARAAAMSATQAEQAVAGADNAVVITEDTPSVTPVQLPTAAVSAESLHALLPDLQITPEVQQRLDDLTGTTVGVATEAVNTAEPGPEAAEKSLSVTKSAGLAVNFQGLLHDCLSKDDKFEDLNRLAGFNSAGVPNFGTPNGIPDLAEFTLLQYALNTESFSVNGLTHDDVVARWQAIRAAFPLPAYSATVPACQKDLIAAYCMLGDTQSVFLGLLLGAWWEWTPLNGDETVGLFGAMPWRFSAMGDLDGDGFDNAFEWAAAMDAVTADPEVETPTFDDFNERYLAYVQDPTQPAATTPYKTLTSTRQGLALSPYPVSARYKPGTVVTLYAIPNAPWVFQEWTITTGGASTTDTAAQIQVTMNNDVTVNAAFGPDPAFALTFADRRLEQAVRVAINKLSESDSILWGDVLDGKLCWLDAKDLGIESLGGIEQLCELQLLDLRGNNIRHIEPLGGLTGLGVLLLGRNRISDVTPLAGLTSLFLLELGRGNQYDEGIFDMPEKGNEITNISPLSSLVNLQYLGLSGNRNAVTGNTITDISAVAAMPAMQMLLLDGSAPADFSPLYGLANLALLALQATGLDDTKMELFNGHLPGLVALDLSKNPEITTLDALAGRSTLEALACLGAMGLQDISALAGQTAAHLLLITDSQVDTVIPLAGRPSESYFHLANNKITDLGAFSDAAQSSFTYTTIVVTGNPLTQTAVCDQIPDIEARDNGVEHDAVCGPSHTLTTSVLPDATRGSIRPFVGHRPFPVGTPVTLEAVQTDPGYSFSHWAGGATGTALTTIVPMNANRNVRAVFVPGGARYLVINEPEGAGTVTPAPGVWACRQGEERWLSATAKPGWAFQHWVDGYGAEVSTVPGLSVKMTANRTVQAVFLPAQVMLTLGRYGAGVTQPDAGRHYYLLNDVVTLQAWPENGECFLEWLGGDGNTTDMISTLVMSTSREVNAWFGSCTASLSMEVGVVGTAQGTVTPGAGIHGYRAGDVAHLFANPLPGSRFDRWEEAQAGVWSLLSNCPGPLDVPLTQSRTIKAVFIPHCVPDDFQAWWIAVTSTTDPPINSYYLGGTNHEKTALGHDIPDLVRMSLLWFCLKDNAHPLHDTAYAAYWNNVVAWYTYVNGMADADPAFVYPTAAELHTYAAYSTFSTTTQTLAVDQFNARYTATGAPAGLLAVPGLGLEGDADGDGFSNIDEWLFTDWAYGHIIGCIGNWNPGTGALEPLTLLYLTAVTNGVAAAASVPNFGAAAGVGGPPTVTVVLRNEGEGNTLPMAATYHMPKYRLSRWWTRDDAGQLVARAENAMTAADFMSMTVTAVPTGDGAFGSWRGGPTVVSGSLPDTVQTQMLAEGAGESGTHKTLLLGADYSVTAVFSHRPGMDAMDLAGDLAALLDAAGESGQTAFFDLSYDSGELTFDDDGAWLYTANGIPDAAEVALLQAILQDAGYEQASKGGVSHEYVWRAYAGNLGLARTQLPTQGESAQRAVAALLTLGDLGHAFHARKLVQTAFGVELNLDEQHTEAGRWLGAKNDANNDGVNNTDAWKAASEEAGASAGTADDAVSNFIGYGADEPTDGGGGGSGGGGAGGGGEGEGECGCWNDTCATAIPNLKVQSSSSLATGPITATGSIESPTECSPIPNVNATAGAPVQLGRKVKVEAAGDGFTTWAAPGAPIDGCNIEKVTFVHGGAPTVAPALSQGSLTIFFDAFHTSAGAVSSGGGSQLVEDPHPTGGYTAYHGAGSMPVTLFATSSYSVPFGEGSLTFELKGWKLSGGSSIPSGAETVPVLTPTVLMGLVSSAEPVYEFVVPGASNGNGTWETVTDAPGTANGGYLMVSRVIGKVEHKYWVPEGGIVPARVVSYCAFPWSGFTWCETEMNGESGGRSLAGDTVVESTTGSADFKQLATLAVEIASEGADPAGAKPECMGYYTLSPARYFYTPDLPAVGTTPASLGEEVTITATHRAGYKFVKWVGTGLATYKLLGFIDIPARLDVENNPITCDTITVTMHSSRTLKAMFEPVGGTLILYIYPPNWDPNPPMDGPGACFGSTGGVGHTFWRLTYDGECIPPGSELDEARGYSYTGQLPSWVKPVEEWRIIHPDPIGNPEKHLINLQDVPLGFYPATTIGPFQPTADPLFIINDTAREGDVLTKKQTFSLSYKQLIDAFEETKARINDSTGYDLASRNCTTDAMKVVSAAGMNDACSSDPLQCPGRLYMCEFNFPYAQ